jgi:hypothetical protein
MVGCFTAENFLKPLYYSGYWPVVIHTFYCYGRKKMRNRGQKFWDWADPELHSRSHDTRLSDGTLINVQVRLSKAGVTQLFFGIYDKEGTMLFEESFDSRPGETMTQAMEWGLAQVRELIDLSTDSPITLPKTECFSRRGSRQTP